jgi:hypothetical protein
MEVKGVKFVDIKSVFFKNNLQKGTGTTYESRLQPNPLTYHSRSLIVQWSSHAPNSSRQSTVTTVTTV